MAINERGVPGPVTALSCHIPPRLFQAWGFLEACVLALLLVSVQAHRLRTRRLAERIEGELLARLRERESIARPAGADHRVLVLTVSDAGQAPGGCAGDRPGHFGAQGMRERAARLGARLRIESGPEGTGSRRGFRSSRTRQRNRAPLPPR